jgi:hypothetical protein
MQPVTHRLRVGGQLVDPTLPGRHALAGTVWIENVPVHIPQTHVAAPSLRAEV